MKIINKAIETTGVVNNLNCLLLDESLPVTQGSRVRVIILATKEVDAENCPLVSLPSPEEYVDKLAGLYKEVWQGVETSTYLNQERESWK
jgi:hypothetical protein